MKLFRKNNDLESKIGNSLISLKGLTLGLAYEHGSVRTRELYEGINAIEWVI